MKPSGRPPRRPGPYDGELKNRYLRFDFPEWVKYLPYEEYWCKRDLRDNLQHLLAQTEELCIKADRANLTLEGLDRTSPVAFPAHEWVLWLIQGTSEMNANRLKRNYLSVWQQPFAPFGAPPAHVKLRNVVLDPVIIRYIQEELYRLCPPR